MYISSDRSHAAFLVDIDFVASRDKNIGGMTYRLDIESGLDPERRWLDGTPTNPDFKAKDNFGHVSGSAVTEWWIGDPATVKANKAKYLRRSSKLVQ